MREKLLLILSAYLFMNSGCGVGSKTAPGSENPVESSQAQLTRDPTCSSAVRNQGQDWRTAASRCAPRVAAARSQEAVLATSSLTVLQSTVPVDQANFDQVPVWSDSDIQMLFEATRDARFALGYDVSGQTFKRRIPWLYPDDGCFARAEVVASMAGDAGRPKPYKLFSFGNLVVHSNNSCSFPSDTGWTPILTWWYHTAPVVKNTSGQVLILDAALNPSAPTPWRDWLKKQLYNVVEGRDGTDAELVNLQVAVADPDAYDPWSKLAGGVNMLGWALNEDQVRYHGFEWDCQLDRGRDPLQVLGDAPPWSPLSEHRDWPAKPAAPVPGHGAAAVAVAPILAWQAGMGATSYEVYLGESPAQMAKVGSSTVPSLPLTMLSPNKQYYWYVAESGLAFDPAGLGNVEPSVVTVPTNGDVWSFTTGQGTALPLFSDDFEDGDAVGWTVHEPAWSVVTDGTKVNRATNTSGYARASAGSSTWTDEAIEVRLKPVSWSGSNRFALVGARFVDINNYYYVALRSNQSIELKRLKGNSPTTLASKSIVFNTGTSYKVKLEAIGSSLKVYVDNVLQLSATDTNFSSGKILVGVWNGTAVFDDVVVTSGAAPALPGAASNPSPAHNGTNTTVWPTLTWTAGTDATSHDVYFGTSSNPPFVGNQGTTSYTPGTLATFTTYYWRIVERNNAGTTTSPVWQFTTSEPAPAAATDPTPAHNATGMSTSLSLTWTPGAWATSHDVYFGTSADPPFIHTLEGVNYSPDLLLPSTTYFWKVVERNSAGTTTSPVWQFTTAGSAPAPATNPAPADSATSVSTTPTLTWTAGAGAASHDVYFGTSSSPALAGTQSTTTFTPGTLAAATTYYWRVVERNSAGTSTGPVWQFTTMGTTPGLLTDDFEDGNADGWMVHDTAWSVVTDGTKVYRATNTSGYARASAGSSAWTDQSIEVRLKPVSWSGTNRFALVGTRFVDINNYYYVALRSNQSIELKRLKGNSPATLATKSITFTTGTWYKVRLEAIGSSLKVYVNEVLQLSATDTNFAAGKAAIGVWNGTAEFDDLKVTAP